MPSVSEPNIFPRFWEQLGTHGSLPALVHCQTRESVTYASLEIAAQIGARRISANHKLVVCLAINRDIQGILCYLSALTAGHAICLTDSKADVSIDVEFVKRYCPDIVLWKGAEQPAGLSPELYQREEPLFGYCMARRVDSTGPPIHPELALLLRTSGSTQNPKAVRLSFDNIAASAWQVVESLRITSTETTALSLPLNYVYGLSILNSSLLAGGSVLLGLGSISDPMFWSACRYWTATMLPTVPMQLKLLQGIDPGLLHLPTEMKMTTSGSALDWVTQEWVVTTPIRRGVQFFSMYGMTEASGRVAVLPHTEFATHPSSVGRPVALGSLQILPTGEIAYKGPNVMMGYSIDRSDLEKGREQLDSLRTGDNGRIDSDGNLYVTGRVSRTSKLLGLRIDLSDLELALAEVAEVAIATDDSSLTVYHTMPDETLLKGAIVKLARRVRIPEWSINVTKLKQFPRTSSGKICYGDLPSR